MAIVSAGYVEVELASKLYPDGANPSGIDSDTDSDGITDWNEVKNEMLRTDANGEYTLLSVAECVAMLGDVPFYVEGALSDSEIKSTYWSAPILPINSDPTSADGDGDGYDDYADLSDLSYDDYSFLDKNVFSLVFNDISIWDGHGILQIDDETLQVYGSELRFEFYWRGNGYTLEEINSNMVLSISAGTLSLQTYVTNDYSQLWEIVPHNQSKGIMFKSKTYLFDSNKYYPQYLCVSNGIASTIVSVSEATSYKVKYYSDIPTFGYAYMSYLKWTDNGEMASNCNSAISNYLYNRDLTFNGFVNGQRVHPSAKAIKLGDYTDGINSCGWVAIYNACLLNGIYIHPCDIVWYIEMKRSTIINAKYGVWPHVISSFFDYIGISCDGGYQLGSYWVGMYFDLDKMIQNYCSIILCYQHKVGVHFVTATWDNALAKYVVYNHYSNVHAEEYFDSLIYNNMGTYFWTSDYRLIALYKIG